MKGQTIYEFFNDYSKDEVDKMITLLSKKDKELVKLRYGNDLNNGRFKSQLSDKQKANYYNNVITRMRKILGGNITKRRDYWRSDISIYDYFDNYTREEIDFVLLKLKKSDKELIHLRCGDNLNKPVVSDKMTESQKIYFSRIIAPKIKKMLENPDINIKEFITKHRTFTIYEYFDKYSKDEIDEVLKCLTNEEKEILSLRFSLETSNNSYNDLSSEQYRMWYLLTKKIQKLLEKPNLFINTNTGRVSKKIYYYFPEYTNEEVDDVIENLPQKDKDIINLRFRTIINDEERVWTKEDSIRFFHAIIPKMRGKLKRVRRINAKIEKTNSEVKKKGKSLFALSRF